MEKKIAMAYQGMAGQVGELLVKRMLPNRYTQTVGHFFFLDYLIPTLMAPKAPTPPNGDFAHPHRGIATFTYLFEGALEHFDSRGNHGIVGPGGAQWMKAGNGIIHDEHPSPAFQETGGIIHGMQFWINLPAVNKAEEPAYKALQAEDFPVVILPENKGSLKVVIGEYEGAVSPVETYARMFNYHLTLHPGADFSIAIDKDFESALFIPKQKILVNGALHGEAEILTFGIDGSEINFKNNHTENAEIILFGGEAYTEPIVAEGPFVMNTAAEIGDAYRDYMGGKYGGILGGVRHKA